MPTRRCHVALSLQGALLYGVASRDTVGTCGPSSNALSRKQALLLGDSCVARLSVSASAGGSPNRGRVSEKARPAAAHSRRGNIDNDTTMRSVWARPTLTDITAYHCIKVAKMEDCLQFCCQRAFCDSLALVSSNVSNVTNMRTFPPQFMYPKTMPRNKVSLLLVPRLSRALCSIAAHQHLPLAL